MSERKRALVTGGAGFLGSHLCGRLLDEGLDSSARRFLNLVDELYDQRTRLIFSAQTTLENLYQGDTLAFEYQRVLSRLHEMQSAAYQQAR